MKVSFTNFGLNVPEKNLYQQGIDYLQHDTDLEFDDVLFLLKNLKNHRSHVWIDTPSASLDFYIEFDNTLWVELYGNNNSVSWAVSEIDFNIGEEILKMAFAGCDFGNKIPNTGREWDAYSGI
jgi:hypothetical protein